MKLPIDSLLRYIRPTLGITLAVFTAGLLPAQTVKPAAALPSVPVTVTNPAVTVQGNVNANVSGTVGVSSLPAVQLSGTPTVQLNSNPTSPAYVDADRPARNGFNAACSSGRIDPVYGEASCTLFTIPAGRQVVLETISCQAELPAGQGPGDVQLVVPNAAGNSGGAQQVSHFLALSKQAGSPVVDIWRVTTPLKAYGSAPAGGTVDIGIYFRGDPTSSAPQGLFCTISGYLVGK